MPGDEAAYPVINGMPDLYPKDQEEHAELLGRLMVMFTAADTYRRTREDKWRRFHRLYRFFVERTNVAAWRSAVFVPYIFSVIENLMPRMAAVLPTFVCEPRGPEDVLPASAMEKKLKYSAEKTSLHLEVLSSIKCALKFGTGVLKTFYAQDTSKAYDIQPVMETVQVPVEGPQLGPDGLPIMDVDGNPMSQMGMEEQQQPAIGQDGQPVMQAMPYEFVTYSGPKACFVDIFDFWVAPDATSVQGARYVIQRTVKDRSELVDNFASGVYRLPPGLNSIGELWSAEHEDGKDIREDETEDGTSLQGDSTRQPCELLEFWLKDGRVCTVANRTAVIRVQENPFDHKQKPYVAFVDYLNEGEFWGMGEIEALEQLQDLANSIFNQRIDNVRLNMDSMFVVNTRAVEDERDFIIRPGGVIRTQGDFLPQEAMQRLDFGDVTSSAYEETANVEALIERVSGVSPFQLGTGDSAGNYNETATGASLITEAGNTKLALKVLMLEMMALQPLAEQWGSIVQQFTEENEYVRLLGPDGSWLFGSLSPEAIQGQLDYSIGTMSTTQSETVMKEQAITLLQSIAGVMPQAVPQLVKDTLEAFGKKNLTPYFTGMPDLDLAQQMMMWQQMGGQIVPVPELFQTQQPGMQPGAPQGNGYAQNGNEAPQPQEEGAPQ